MNFVTTSRPETSKEPISLDMKNFTKKKNGQEKLLAISALYNYNILSAAWA